MKHCVSWDFNKIPVEKEKQWNLEKCFEDSDLHFDDYVISQVQEAEY